MIRYLVIAVVAASLVPTPVSADEHSRRKAAVAAKKNKDKDRKAESGASCKAPAVGSCASCAITCRPGETATCGPGMLSGDLCARPPTCTCK